MKILVIGANGMAGHMIQDYLIQHTSYEIWATSRSEKSTHRRLFLDALDTNRLSGLLLTLKPDLVINAIGLLNQDAENHPQWADQINGELPQLLSNYGIALGFKLIHISTDCVFSGASGDYRESDTRDASGVYPESKKRGENIDPRHLLIRTSIIGPELRKGIGLFHWYMNQRKPVQGFRNVWWNGVTTLELAKCIHWAIEHPLSGLVHLCVRKKISKHDLLLTIQDIFPGNRAPIQPNNAPCSNKSLVNTRCDFPYVPPDYQTMLVNLREWMELAPPSRYAQYDWVRTSPSHPSIPTPKKKLDP
ncbi:dTDP-4-dehydrorhamnose reductase family protein [Marininema halotolerans]|uniref:dTDP-4-dehydrorhamnose reductase n=1 Tax=Marininema halotolerans TaxID=1155944 RepID=A0A1I6RNR9_9BACL|nr:SDR family oxidoreductase [Marininema halotolerans]SFS66349.1 dTDP-4-dehydrorhamnose reductase [Marininema halotolerans]